VEAGERAAHAAHRESVSMPLRRAKDDLPIRKRLRFRFQQILRYFARHIVRSPLIIEVGGTTLDRGALLFIAPSRPPVSLTPIEARLLDCLMRNADKVIPREVLMRQIEDDDTADGPLSVDIYIRRLRLKIEEDPDRPAWIETVAGNGYRFRSRREQP
jgi:DNA-binding response OmpR family regulator